MLSGVGFGPVSATGIRLAFDRRAPALPVRSTIIAVTAALAVLAGALTFSASLNRLETDHQRWGYGWDLMLDTTDADAEAFMTSLAGDADIDGVSLLQRNFTYVRTDGRVDGIRAYGLGTRSGHVGYAVIDGAQPDGSDEVVIGTGLAKAAHLSIGDVIAVAVCPCTGDEPDPKMTNVRIVGTALFPEADDGTFNTAVGSLGAGLRAACRRIRLHAALVKLRAGPPSPTWHKISISASLAQCHLSAIRRAQAMSPVSTVCDRSPAPSPWWRSCSVPPCCSTCCSRPGIVDGANWPRWRASG